MFKNSKLQRCSHCNVVSELIEVNTIEGVRRFCGPVCLVHYQQKKNILDSEYEQKYNTPIKSGIKALTKEVKELEILIENLKRIDYFSTITYNRRKRITLKRIRDLCDKMKIQIDSLKYDSTFRAEDEIELTVVDVIMQFHWTLYNLKKMMNTDVAETQAFIERTIDELEQEYPEIKNDLNS